MPDYQCHSVVALGAILLCFQTSLVAPVTQAEIDAKVKAIRNNEKFHLHEDPCLTIRELMKKTKILEKSDPTLPSTQNLYDNLFYQCDFYQDLYCDPGRSVCQCRGENAYWVPDPDPAAIKKRIGKCYLSYKSACNPYPPGMNCGPAGVCKSVKQSAKLLCDCRTQDQNDPSCVEYKNMTYKKDLNDKFGELYGRLEMFQMAEFKEPCLSHILFSPDTQTILDLWQLLIVEEAKPPGTSVFRTHCNFLKGLVCINSACDCMPTYSWDYDNKTCGGYLGATCSQDYFEESASFRTNSSCAPGFKCVSLVPRPYFRAAEIQAKRPLGCCSMRNRTGKLKLPHILVRKPPTYNTRLHWACPDKIISGSKLSLDTRLTVLTTILVRVLFAKVFLI